MRFIAFNIDGGYTEFRKKGKGEAEEVCNYQLLCDSAADSLDDFRKELRNMWKDYHVGSTMILRIDEHFKIKYIDI